MTKEEALQAMTEGKKIRHRYFAGNEYMKTGSTLDIEFEDGCQCPSDEFWRIRNGEEWLTGWSIYEVA